MDLELGKIYTENALSTMGRMGTSILDLTVTSPPYDGLRKYNGYSFDFENIAKELYRVTRHGGVVVWVVGDSTVNGSESGTSFRQALFFKEIGFNLHDTMIYQKVGMPMNHNRYEQEFEYMFILSKGKPKTFNPIKRKCAYYLNDSDRAGQIYGRGKHDEKNRKVKSGKSRTNVKEDVIIGNIWKYNVGYGHSSKDSIAFKHPAIFPEKLAYDQIISWSNEGDLIYDPFAGSGTVPKVAHILKRRWVASEISGMYVEEIANVRLKIHSNTLF